MNYLKKSSFIGISTMAVMLVGTALANAQVYPAGSSITAVGNAGSFVYVPTAYNPSQVVVTSNNTVPANYQAGYYNYPNAVTTTSAVNGTWVNGVWTPYVSYTYPGVPNTGGVITSNTVNTTSSGYTTANPPVGTYIPPMTSYNGMGLTGGVSVPVGYTPAAGPNGSILTTSNWNNTTGTGAVYTSYPGVPNTGGPIVNVNGYLNGNGYLNSNGLVNTTGTVHVNGVVTMVTPTAIGLSSGGQTWTIGWNSNTAVSTANGNANISGGQLSVGDMIEVIGVIDQTFSSKINATSIRDLSFH